MLIRAIIGWVEKKKKAQLAFKFKVKENKPL